MAILLSVLLAACAPPTIKRIPRAPGTEDAREIDRKTKPVTSKGLEETIEEGSFPDGDDKTEQAARTDVDLTNFKERLIGLDAAEVGELLGPPSLERIEPPATIWQFRATKCIVDVFLFADDGDSKVDHVEVRPRKTETVDEKDCFASILAGDKGPPPDAAPGKAPAGDGAPDKAPADVGAPDKAPAGDGAPGEAIKKAPLEETPVEEPFSDSSPNGDQLPPSIEEAPPKPDK